MFRMIFGNPKHSRLLIHFLNCVINPVPPIKSVEIKKTELTPEYAMQKGVRLDIVAVTDGGEILNIEMQRKDEADGNWIINRGNRIIKEYGMFHN